jgi:hypothetical protein
MPQSLTITLKPVLDRVGDDAVDDSDDRSLLEAITTRMKHEIWRRRSRRKRWSSIANTTPPWTATKARLLPAPNS